MGGGVTLNTYFKVREDRPCRIKSLVLIDSPGYPQKMPWFIQFAKLPVLSSVDKKLLPHRLATRLVLQGDYYDKNKITEEQINTYAYYDILPGAWEAVVQSAKQIVPGDLGALASQHKTITVPVLIIWGEDDEVIPLSVGLNFKRDIPASELVIFPKCGHISLEEEPVAATLVIQVFLHK